MHFTLNPRTYSYGPDNEKISSGDGNTGQHVYLDDYEKITKNNVTTEYYFLENDVIVTKKTGTSGSSSIKLYQAVTDNLGSILAVYGETNNLVFKAKYDVWGKQTVYKNALGLYRGYTGHEMPQTSSLSTWEVECTILSLHVSSLATTSFRNQQTRRTSTGIHTV